jgi:AcrR family transcriptional regulator/quercetin dioxygenase-like cupin family protein
LLGLATRIPPRKAADRLRPRRRPGQARSRATLDAILTAAARIFADRGYAAGTTNHIADEAGVSVGSLYEYFPNKDAVLVALLEAHLRDSERVLGELVREVARERASLAAVTRRFVAAMVDLHAHDPGLHRVLFEQAPLPARVLRTLEALEDASARAVEELIRRAPETTVQDARLAARLVVQAVEGLTHRLVLYPPDSANTRRVADEIAELVIRYLTAPPQRGAGEEAARHRLKGRRPMAAKPFIVAPKDYAPTLDIVGEHVTVLASGEATGSYELFFQRGPEGSGPPPHSHPWDESFFVTSGLVEFGIGAESSTGEPGTLVHLPAGTVHWFRFGKGGGEMVSMTSRLGASRMFTDMAREIGPVVPDLGKLQEVGGRHGLKVAT